MNTNKRKCILLVDDNPVQNFLNFSLLNSFQVAENIRVCSNGAEALEFLCKSYADYKLVPDLILLDLYMPSVNGFEFLDAYKKMPSNQICKKILFLTASTELDELDKIKSLGYELINKPLTPEKLINILSE